VAPLLSVAALTRLIRAMWWIRGSLGHRINHITLINHVASRLSVTGDAVVAVAGKGGINGEDRTWVPQLSSVLIGESMV
jgi:hypothetical protein